MVQEEQFVTVEFLEKCSFGTAGVYNRGEIATFPADTAQRLFLPNGRTGKIVAKKYVPPLKKNLDQPVVDKQVKEAPKKKGGAL